VAVDHSVFLLVGAVKIQLVSTVIDVAELHRLRRGGLKGSQDRGFQNLPSVSLGDVLPCLPVGLKGSLKGLSCARCAGSQRQAPA
jgi:hypothetical protein